MRVRFTLSLFLLVAFLGVSPSAPEKEKLYDSKINVTVPHISSDKSVKYDYDIVYVRARRDGDKIHKRYYTDIATPVTLEPGADLMLLHPDGKEEVLVEGGEGAVTDPVVSYDGESVYYTLIHTLKGAGPWQPPSQGADIYKIHVKSRKITRLTHQVFTPNTGAADWSADCRKNEKDKTHLSYGVLNFGAYPLPGGRIVFTSNRNAFRPPKGYPRITLQIFVMDDDGSNVECIGHLNLAGALHPVVLRDGRIIFSSLESQGIRGDILWGIWSIHPDGTNWNPLVSAFDTGGAPNAFHFQTQLSDGSIIIEGYYNQNNSGFGTYIKLKENTPKQARAREPRLGGGYKFFAPPLLPNSSPKELADEFDLDGYSETYATFGPAHMANERNKPWRFGRHENGKPKLYRMPFMPSDSVAITPFANIDDGPAGLSDLKDKTSPRVGKFTHPSGAPDNHLLTIYSPGPTNHQYTYLPQLDGGIYLIKKGEVIDEPAQMLMIKNDPKYNEQWPRALVPYKRIYGVSEPKTLPRLANDGSRSKHLPEGTPFALVGTSSLYKRESYPNGAIASGSVTAGYAGGNDPWKGLDAFTSHGNGMPLNWHNQGAEAGLYENKDIHAVRILAMEPTTDRNRGPKSGRLFHTHANERLRILGEIPVRKFLGEQDAPLMLKSSDGQPLDSDRNPDTSFRALIPADVAFTFQTLDKDGMVLNMAQTWHQLRPGEVRTDCGGCHAHSQRPTDFAKSFAAGQDTWDLTARTPLLTAKELDESDRKWDAKDQTGLRYAKGVTSVEYHRDIVPIFERSCVACHSVKNEKPAGNLTLDGDDENIEYVGKVPGGYYRLAADGRGKYGHKPVGYDSWGYPQASRYVRKFQARRSLLVWKVFGKRLDGFSNDDHPSETEPGSGKLAFKGKEVETKKIAHRLDIDYVGGVMPPPDAVKQGKVKPLTDEDRRTLVRWIDLGCPLDRDYDPKKPDERGYGFACDDQRPTLALTYPVAGKNAELSRILVGMHDYGTGLNVKSFSVTADFDIGEVKAGSELASLFRAKSKSIWEMTLDKPIASLQRGTLTVSVKDNQGNVTKVVRTFSVGG